jgi:hypothetical protein
MHMPTARATAKLRRNIRSSKVVTRLVERKIVPRI